MQYELHVERDRLRGGREFMSTGTVFHANDPQAVHQIVMAHHANTGLCYTAVPFTGRSRILARLKSLFRLF